MGKPVLLEVVRASGGGWLATWSVAPGTRVSIRLPPEGNNPGTLAQLEREVVPTMISPTQTEG